MDVNGLTANRSLFASYSLQTGVSVEIESSETEALDEQPDSGLSSLDESSALSSPSLNEAMDEFGKQIADAVLKRIMEFRQEALEELMGKPHHDKPGSGNDKSHFLSDMELYSERGIAATISHIYDESTASLSLHFEGEAITDDNRSTRFGVDVNLSQSLVMNMQQQNQEASASGKSISKLMELYDPLVVSYSGDPVDLSDKTFSFDLDSDGETDQISMLKEGAGYLVLDKNENGQIDNGNELFGPKSGDGFADISEYDADSNGQIDKDDPIYDSLRIWKKDDTGNDSLAGLGEMGIGVIYLNAVDTKFDFFDPSGIHQGRMQKSAAIDFLDGRQSTIHHIDLAKHKTPSPVDAPSAVQAYEIKRHTGREGSESLADSDLNTRKDYLSVKVENFKSALSDVGDSLNKADFEEMLVAVEKRLMQAVDELSGVESLMSLRENGYLRA